ncbi:hypothetical protein [Alcaligenes faecalis]|uniref:hypothetical protein n=1 Tax=Alcaligenes faecalis TaxID=511 RepID=UPI000F0B77FB|nr:hypothetical protein [Alcaligenes faecalis]AYR19884.1 hypothetical protein D6I95_05620 [Alcaligenes faecalis]
MTFTFKSDTLFSRTAKRLREILPAYTSAQIPDSFNFKDATAYTLGHKDVRALRAAAKQGDAVESSWDEECDATELDARHLYQASRLDEYANLHRVQLEKVKEIIGRWQPSAARPQNPVLTADKLDELRAAGVPMQAYCLLLAYELTNGEPTLEELELFRNGIKSSTGFTNQAIPLYIGPLAVRLVNRRVSPGAELGIALLEMLCETSFLYPKVNLARALFYGWGVTPNLERAKSLCKFVSKALEAGEDVFVDDVSYVDFYTLQAQLYVDGISLEERTLAFESTKKAAAYGSGPAALAISHYYSPLPLGMEPDCFSGVVQPNEMIRLRYWQLAIERGYNTVTHSFPKKAS